MSTENTRPVHSPLGASGAERWLNCPGSISLLKALTLPESDEPDYRTEGTAAHELAATCLSTGQDTWEFVDETYNGVKVSPEMADAVQLYLNTVRPDFERTVEGRQCFIEYPISSPRHPLFYGTVDAAVIVAGTDYHGQENLIVTDYKHGEGIAVDAEHNPQLMYYAFGFLEEYSEVDKVTLRIVQPRAFHPDGQIREWHTTAAAIRQWFEEVLLPGMLRTEMEAQFDAGPWCRFCPAKLVCPMLTHLFKAACTANPQTVVNVTDQSLGLSYAKIQGVKFYMKALEDEVFRRLNTGVAVPGTKLVPKKANRIYKTDAQKVFQEKFGDEAMTKVELKSPAEMEKLGPAAKLLVKEYAYTPQTGLTVALDDDKRPAVKVQSTTEAFGAALGLSETCVQIPDKTAEVPAQDDGLFDPEPPANPLTPPEDDLEIPAFLKRKPVDTKRASA